MNITTAEFDFEVKHRFAINREEVCKAPLDLPSFSPTTNLLNPTGDSNCFLLSIALQIRTNTSKDNPPILIYIIPIVQWLPRLKTRYGSKFRNASHRSMELGPVDRRTIPTAYRKTTCATKDSYLSPTTDTSAE